MKSRKAFVFGLMPLLLLSCGGKSPYMEQDIDVTIVSHFHGGAADPEYRETVRYSDRYFLEDSATMNADLALLSSLADGAASSNQLDETGLKAKAMLQRAGFSKVALNAYYEEGVTKRDSIGAIIGQKPLKGEDGKDYTLLALFPRSAGYVHEWFGDFNMGVSGIHQGFQQSRDEMLRFLKRYIESSAIKGDIKLWCAGYSRGAATVNLLAGYLLDEPSYLGQDVSLSPKDLYCYTIGTPRTLPKGLTRREVLSVSGPRSEGYMDTSVPAYVYSGEGTIDPEDAKYGRIHNFTAVGDYVTKLPYPEWGFTRYGTTSRIAYGGEAFAKELAHFDEETAASFAAGRTYATEVPTKTFDFHTYKIVDGEGKVSPDALIEQYFASLLDFAGSREEVVQQGYADLLGAVSALYGLGIGDFIDALKSDTPSLIKTLAFAYLAYVGRETGLSDDKATAKLLMDAMGLLGKPIKDESAYSDQDFLADLLDYLINDYQDGGEGEKRAKRLANSFPEPYGSMYKDFLGYAKDNGFAPKTFDGLVHLATSYLYARKDSLLIKGLLGILAEKVPADYVNYLSVLTGKTYDPAQYPTPHSVASAAIADIVEMCVVGRYDSQGALEFTPEKYRYSLYTIASGLLLSNSPKLANLLFNGSNDGEKVVTRDPQPLNEVVDEALTLLLPEAEGGRLSLIQAAELGLSEVLAKGKTEENAYYVDLLAASPKKAIDMVINTFFRSPSGYDLKADIDAALTFADGLSFLIPAHYNEMYISYFRANKAA